MSPLVVLVWQLAAGTTAADASANCASSSQCQSGLVCIHNHCQYEGFGESCQTSNDCTKPLRCFENQCATAPNAADVLVKPKPRRSARTKVPYNLGDPIPPGATLVEHSLIGLWAAGIPVLALTWFVTGITTSTVCNAGCVNWAPGVSWIPLVGPFIDLRVASADYVPFLIATGVLQAGGTAMIILGTVLKKRYLLLGDESFSSSLVPAPLAHGVGMVWEGHF